MTLTGLTFPLMDLFVSIFNEKVYLVGGTIRDYLLYNAIDETGDIDLIVVDHTYEEIEARLKPYGKTNTVGKSFAVVKFTRDARTFDISVPRRDRKKDPSSHDHKNFIIEYGPHIRLDEDLGRRDFTCNSVAMRLIDREIIDPFNGIDAIRNKKIVMTGPETFVDDPLRILRAARFASVHRFAVDEEIYVCSKDVPLSELSKERVVDELFRLLLESDRPSVGLHEYFKLAVLEKLFPQLYALTLTIQDAIFHPEKDEYGHHTVWHHTLMAIDVAKKLCARYAPDDERSLALLLGVLLHDVGKAVTTKWEFKKGRMTITSIYHDSKGVEIADLLLTELKIETRKNFPLRETVLNLVRNHHRIYELYRSRDEIGFKAISRLVKDVGDEDVLLLLLDFSDRQSREPDPLAFEQLDEIAEWYLKKKEEFHIDKETIQPLVLGRDLIPLGITPGVQMGVYLKMLYEKQLDGEFSTKEDGLTILNDYLVSHSN
ncbi:MAG: CCA tRNA nucleotidyltransferase [Candidatus Omnitrophota bacterium]